MLLTNLIGAIQLAVLCAGYSHYKLTCSYCIAITPTPILPASSATSKMEPDSSSSIFFLIYLSLRFDPDTTFMHQIDLSLNHLLSIFSMLHWFAVQIEILRVDGLLIEQLVEFGPQILEPVIPLGACPVIAQRFYINDTA